MLFYAIFFAKKSSKLWIKSKHSIQVKLSWSMALKGIGKHQTMCTLVFNGVGLPKMKK